MTKMVRGERFELPCLPCGNGFTARRNTAIIAALPYHLHSHSQSVFDPLKWEPLKVKYRGWGSNPQHTVSKTALCANSSTPAKVGLVGFEPTTSRSQSESSDQTDLQPNNQQKVYGL